MFFKLGFHQDHATAWTAQGFMRRGGDEIRVRHGVWIHARCDQTGVVRHVDHEVRADFFGDFRKAFKVNAQGECGRTGDDEFWLGFAREGFHFVVVDVFVRVQTVGHDVEPFTAHVQFHTVGQVTTFGQAHAHDGVTWLEHGEKYALVRLRAGVRLYVGRFRAEQLFHTVNRELLHDVDVFATAVVAFARVAFGVFIGQLRTLRFHHRRAGVVFGRDQFDVVLLALDFLRHRDGELRVNVGNGVVGSGKHRGSFVV